MDSAALPPAAEADAGIPEGRTAIVEPDWAVVRRATALFPVIRAAAKQGQADRQVTTEVTDAMRSAGLLNTIIPQRLGGLGASARTTIEVIAELARADGSAGWISALVNSCTYIASTFDEASQKDIWDGNRGALACGIFFPGVTQRIAGNGEKVEGGFLLTGRYPYASGCAIADWAELGMLLEMPDGTSVPALGLVPRSQWRVEDTWYTLGMRGTGSNTLVVEKVFVPEHRVQTFEALQYGAYASPYYGSEPQSMYPCMPSGTIMLGAVALGLARAALDYVLETSPKRVVAYTVYDEARNSPSHQLAVANAASDIDTAYLLAARATSDMDTIAAARTFPTDLQRARIRMDTGKIMTLCKNAVDELMTTMGAGAFAQEGTLGRIWRDINIAARHAFATPHIGSEVYGRLLLNTDNPLTVGV
jgi:alkylation response protein AidB-like acyl-CoA dehydrogenase